MIPKKLHYIWLGGNPLPEIALKCMESWKKFCPDYEIVVWDESNLNLDINTYCREAYDAKKFAFCSDVLRYDVLYKHGGVYLDIDVEFVKPIDDMLNNHIFLGFESPEFVAPGLIMGAEAGSETIKTLLSEYDDEHFVLENGKFNYKTICARVTEYLCKNCGLVQDGSKQLLDGNIAIYPVEYFCPYNAVTKKIEITDATRSIHWFNASWVPKPTLWKKLKDCVAKIIKKIIGEENVKKIKEKRKS